MQPTLAHTLCSLAALSHDHAAGLADVAGSATAQGGLLHHNTLLHIPAPKEAAAYIDRALKAQAVGRELPYAIVSPDGAVLGTTRFQFIALGSRRADIGGTWLAPAAQGKAVNAASKWLLLRHAFETMGLQRVGFTVHPDNARSRAALLGMGAQFEGLLRGWQTLHGAQADACSYSVLAGDWAAVRAQLVRRMAKQTQHS
jgi:N-acetyltransferase